VVARDDGRPDGSGLGRLDLDDLDAVDLDLLDSDDVRPRWMEDAAAALERSGAAAFGRRHRRGLLALSAVVALALGWLAVSATNRPAPLTASPRVTARTSASEPSAVLTIAAGTGEPVAVSQQVVLTVAEPSGVEVTALRLVGPALTAGGEAPVHVDRSGADGAITVSAAIDCATPDATTAAVGAGRDSYSVQILRRGPTGDERTDDVPLLADAGLADVVRQTCLQMALDRDLHVTGVNAIPVPGAVATDIDISVTNRSPRTWAGLAVSASASPQLLQGGGSGVLAPGAAGDVAVRLHPLDCADPTAVIARGLPVRVAQAPSGVVPPVSSPPILHLALPDDVLSTVASAFDTVCGPARPTATASSALMREAGTPTTAGLLEIMVALHGVPSGTLDVDHPWVVSDGGSLRLGGTESPVKVVDGVATITLLWQAPPCADVAAHGGLHVAVIAPGAVPRPYAIAVGGEPLRTTLSRLCGHDVASVVH
jgi:hypothetical protein